MIHTFTTSPAVTRRFVDLSSFVLSAAVLTAHQFYLRYRLRQDPAYTTQSVNALARSAWVEALMRTGQADALPVQTLRNSLYASIFLASTAISLIIGVLALTANGDGLGETWLALPIFGVQHSDIWQIKLTVLLLDFFVAFFAFSMAIRLFNNAGYMINVSSLRGQESVSLMHAAHYMQRAGKHFDVGVRAYYFAIPLIAWLLVPWLTLIVTLMLTAWLHKLDVAPRLEGVDLSNDGSRQP